MKMKKQIFQAKKTKLIARVMLFVLLLASALSFAGCGKFDYEWEVNTHEEFVKNIENYNSIHDLYVNTFISFDLDNNDEVSAQRYSAFSMISPAAESFTEKYGYICDIHNESVAIIFLFYLRSNNENANEFAYKIKCSCTSVDFNYTEDDKIEILTSECRYYSYSDDLSSDLFYEESLLLHNNDKEKQPMYNHVYHYSVYVNGAEVCCIHISSVDEASEEKLDEIIQMMSDSLVVINADGFFIWR